MKMKKVVHFLCNLRDIYKEQKCWVEIKIFCKIFIGERIGKDSQNEAVKSLTRPKMKKKR